MSLSRERKTTDSQSPTRPRHTHLRARHRMLASGLLLLVSNTVASHASAGARKADGSCPWGEPVTPAGARRVFSYTGTVPESPEEVFPRLCPVLEYDWLDDWTCTMRYSESGVAEQGCAFDTRIQVGESWLCTRYEPSRAIQYVVWLRIGWMVLDLTLTDLGDGTTELRWQRTFTATRPMGRKLIGKMTEERVTAEMKATHDRLVTHLDPAR
jgi:hypothetical protein